MNVTSWPKRRGPLRVIRDRVEPVSGASPGPMRLDGITADVNSSPETGASRNHALRTQTHRGHPAFQRRAGSGAHSPHDAIMPLFCPTGQLIFVKYELSDFDDLATVHGIVFDFFVSCDPGRPSSCCGSTARAGAGSSLRPLRTRRSERTTKRHEPDRAFSRSVRSQRSLPALQSSRCSMRPSSSGAGATGSTRSTDAPTDEEVRVYRTLRRGSWREIPLSATTPMKGRCSVM